MHTGEGAKHASHAAPARHPRLRALVCAAASLEGVGGQDTTTWTAERMSETSAAVVTTDPGAVMGVAARRSRQQGFGPRSTHSISNRVQRPLLCSRRQTQNEYSPCAALEGEEGFHERPFFSRHISWPPHPACEQPHSLDSDGSARPDIAQSTK